MDTRFRPDLSSPRTLWIPRESGRSLSTTPFLEDSSTTGTKTSSPFSDGALPAFSGQTSPPPWTLRNPYPMSTRTEGSWNRVGVSTQETYDVTFDFWDFTHPTLDKLLDKLRDRFLNYFRLVPPLPRGPPLIVCGVKRFLENSPRWPVPL